MSAICRRKSVKSGIAVLLISGGLGSGAGVGSAAQAQSFSADLVLFNAGGEAAAASGKIYLEGHKTRIETPEISDVFFIVDPTEKTSYLVRPGQRIFMDAKQSSKLTQLLVQVDPAAPCLEWQAMAQVAGVPDTQEWRCEPLGEETLDGHITVKYKAISPRGEAMTVWIDPQYRFPQRIRSDNGAGFDIKGMEDGPQAESLFRIPAKYGKFDPQQLIERIKQSDVWVEPPK